MNASTPENDASPIEFPAALAVKAMGLNDADFEQLVRGIVEPLIAPATPDKVTLTPSSKGKYVSVRVHFVARDQAQLEQIYLALRAEPRVLFTL